MKKRRLAIGAQDTILPHYGIGWQARRLGGQVGNLPHLHHVNYYGSMRTVAALMILVFQAEKGPQAFFA
jgi:hypothetical protein